VFAHWDCWSAALVAAGMPATVREYDLPVKERVAAARGLAAEGISPGRDRQVSRRRPADGPPVPDGRHLPLRKPAGEPSATRCRPCAGRVRAAPRWSAPEISEAMRRWERETCLQPTVRSWGSGHSALSKWHREHPAWPSAHQVIARFSSWREALRMAGFAPLKRAWSREEAIAVLQHAAGLEGRRPRQTEWMRATAQRPAASTVRNLLGTWQAALHAAAIAPEG
jgi:hypothetical protein